MAESAFGVDHGDFSKRESNGGEKMSGGRKATGTYFGAYHSVAAGKKGKRAKGAARSYAYGTGGAIGGGATAAGVTALATKGKSAPATIGAGYAGAMGGSLFGNNRALHVNNRKGYYKKEE